MIAVLTWRANSLSGITISRWQTELLSASRVKGAFKRGEIYDFPFFQSYYVAVVNKTYTVPVLLFFAFSKMLCRHLTSYLYCYTFFDSGTGFAARKRLNYARNRFPKMKKSCIVVFICLSNHLEWISAKWLRNQLTIWSLNGFVSIFWGPEPKTLNPHKSLIAQTTFLAVCI